MSPQPAASSRVSRSLTVSLSPALNCSVEFAATGQIHVVSCCPHQVSVPQRRRDSNLYASAPHRGSSRGEACQQGYCCLHQQAREHYGVSLPALVRKPDEHRAAMLRVGCRRMPSVVIANAATGKLVPHQQMREAVRKPLFQGYLVGSLLPIPEVEGKEGSRYPRHRWTFSFSVMCYFQIRT